MGKRSTFKRAKGDRYLTPWAPVADLAPHLPARFRFAEPCAADGRLIDHLRRLGDPADAPFLAPAWLERMGEETRARGLALRDAGEFRPQTASIAAPVTTGRGVQGCLSMIWIRSAMSSAEATARFGPPLREAAAEIAARLERDGPLGG